MKNKSTLLNISNNEYFLYLGGKKFMQKHFIFKKIRGITKKKFQIRSDQRKCWHWLLKGYIYTILQYTAHSTWFFQLSS